MNLIEKILARASGRSEVVPGDIVVADVDLMLLHDLSASFVSRVFRENFSDTALAHPERVAIVFDHTFSPPRETSAEALKSVREFAREHGIRNLFDCGSGSLHHVVLEHGLCAPGRVIVGCDSHTTIYGALGAFSTGVGNDSMAALGLARGKAWFRVPECIQVRLEGSLGNRVSPRDVAQFLVGYMGEDGAVYEAIEYAGPFLDALPVEERMLFPLMAIDVGAKAGFIDPDDLTLELAKRLSQGSFDVVHNDPDVEYERIVEVSVGSIEPQVACPPTVGNVVPVGQVEGTPLQVAEIGGSTGGRLTDLRVAAEYLEKKRVHRDVRLQIVPVTAGTYRRAVDEGLVTALLDAGAIVFPPGAGSNQAVNMGAMASGESMISTQARNFPGRNGSAEAAHYLASAHTVAASAIAGKITDPRR